MRGAGMRVRTYGVALALTALAAAGCGQANPSVAAYVGSEQITEREVDSALAAIKTALGPQQDVDKSVVVNVLVQGELASQIAAERKIPLSDAERDALLTGSNVAPLLAVPAAKAVAYDLADTEIVSRALGDDGYLAAIGSRSVVLNPRFGVLDPTQKSIIADSSGSLSTPAPVTAGS